MHVNKYIVKMPGVDTTLNPTGTTLMVPLTLNSQHVDQYDIIKTKFIDVEVENSINPIVDWEQGRFSPVKDFTNPLGNLINSITYSLYFLDSAKNFISATYSNAEFTDIDIKNRKNGFTKSFLRLNFYDSDNVGKQKLIAFLIIYPRVDDKFFASTNLPTKSFFTPLGSTPWGTMNPVNQINLEFTVGDSIKDKSKDGEGFFLYYYKDEVSATIPKEMFMRASFSNAKTGKVMTLMSTSNNKLFVHELNKATNGTANKNNRHTKYVLTKHNTGYYYKVDTNYSSNINILGDIYEINLYETFVL
jgi:hypothetical protein